MTKIHAADAADRAMIAEAIGFTAFLRTGPSQKHVARFDRLEDACKKADELRAENPGRDAVVYAITASGATIPVPRDMQGIASAPKGTAADVLGKTFDSKASAQRAAWRAGLKPTDFDLVENGGIFTVLVRKAVGGHRDA